LRMSAAWNIPPIRNAEDYGPMIHDLYMRRELIALCQEVLRDVYDTRLEHERGAADIIEQTEGRLSRLADTGDTGGEGKRFQSGSSRWICQASSWASVFSPNRAGFQAMRKGEVQVGGFPPLCRDHVAAYWRAVLHRTDLSIDAICTRARRVKRQYGIRLLITDYLQRLRGTDSFQARQNRTTEVSEITRSLNPSPRT